jgi:putative flippase GtrA
MAALVSGVRDKFRGPEGTKFYRYSLTSVVAVAVSVVLLVFFNGVIGLSAWVSSTLATAVATVPNYTMNRKWAWGKTGRGHLWKEVLPFWALAFAGWGLSTISVHAMETSARRHHFSHLMSTASVTLVYVGAFGVLWIGRFFIVNKMLFAPQLDGVPSELDDIRSGVSR